MMLETLLNKNWKDYWSKEKELNPILDPAQTLIDFSFKKSG